MKNDQAEHDIISAVFTAYTTGNFESFFPWMTDDYTHISFWVLEVYARKDQAQRYYRGKGESIRRGGSFARGSLVRIISSPNRVRPNGVYRNGVRMLEDRIFLHRDDNGKIAVLLRQVINGEENHILAVPTITEEGKLAQILITDPVYYQLEPFSFDKETL